MKEVRKIVVKEKGKKMGYHWANKKVIIKYEGYTFHGYRNLETGDIWYYDTAGIRRRSSESELKENLDKHMRGPDVEITLEDAEISAEVNFPMDDETISKIEEVLPSEEQISEHKNRTIEKEGDWVALELTTLSGDSFLFIDPYSQTVRATPSTAMKEFYDDKVHCPDDVELK